MVFKAHSGHMATADLVGCAIQRAAERTGMPKGVFNMVFGGGVGEWLVKHPAIQAVGFTGSLKGGDALCRMAAERPQPIPVFAEMSSINPVIILAGRPGQAWRSHRPRIGRFGVPGRRPVLHQPGPGDRPAVAAVQPTAGRAWPAPEPAGRPDHAQRTVACAATSVAWSTCTPMPVSSTWPARRRQAARRAPSCSRPMPACWWSLTRLLQEEVFGPTTVAVEVQDNDQLRAALLGLRGQLTATLIGEPEDLQAFAWLVPLLEEKVGRILVNGYPTGVEVCDAMVHGGPYPATSDARGTSVGTLAIDRFLRPVCYQNYPQALLPEALRDGNPLGLRRLVNGQWSEGAI
ncbi:aldehyde dehydrogenase family protein [Pseudomonas putida S11]|nr:aldehyde dehydrogenase family protein [Pseudomonas putida S11]